MKTFGVVGEENKKSETKARIFFPTLGGQIIYFIYKNCQALLPESIDCPQNKPGNKRIKL
jgi:hypothetical protein